MCLSPVILIGRPGLYRQSNIYKYTRHDKKLSNIKQTDGKIKFKTNNNKEEQQACYR